MIPASRTYMFSFRLPSNGWKRLLSASALLVLVYCGSPRETEAAANREPRPDATQSSAAANRLLADGRAAIEANCADCQGGTREGLLRGIDLTEQSLALGAPRADVLAVLVEGYNTMALVYGKGAEAEHYWDTRKVLLRELVELRPDDAQVHVEYARVVDSLPERVRHLENAVKLEPSDTEARFALSIALVEAGKTEIAFAEAVKAISESHPSRGTRYARRVAEALELRGEVRQAAILREYSEQLEHHQK